MLRPRRLPWTASVLVAALAVLPCAAAWGDADPASDFLPGFDSYLPYGNTVAKPTQGQLDKLLKVARARKEPFKVAVIATPPDLGAVTALFNKPQQYAKFLYREIKPIITGGDVTLLIVMPNGIGVIGRDATTKGGKAALAVRVPKNASATALAQTAVSTVEKIAAADGHPLPKVAPTKPAATGGSGGTHRRVLGLLAAALLAAIGVAVLLRARLLQRT
jgi:hypothetical protein